MELSSTGVHQLILSHFKSGQTESQPILLTQEFPIAEHRLVPKIMGDRKRRRRYPFEMDDDGLSGRAPSHQAVQPKITSFE